MMVGETILYKYKYMHIHKYTYMTESIYGCGRSIWIMVGEDFMQIQIHTQIQIHIQIQIQIRIYDREYTWVRAQHLDDGGGRFYTNSNTNTYTNTNKKYKYKYAYMTESIYG